MIEAFTKCPACKILGTSYSLDVLELARTFDHPEFENLFRECIRYPSGKSRENIRLILEILGFSTIECAFVFNFIDGYQTPSAASLTPFYQDTIPTEDLEYALKKLKKRSFRFMPPFFFFF